VEAPKFKRLREAIDWSISQIEKPRNQRVDTIKQYVGSHYSTGGTDKHVPANLLELAVTIYVRALAARSPRVMVTTGVDALKPAALNMQIALNQVPAEIDLAGTLRRVVLEALFGIGVVKVGLTSGGATLPSDNSGQYHDAGSAFVDVVTLDDYFVDMSAKNRAGIQFEGNDYWVGIEEAKAIYSGHDKDYEVAADEHTVHGDRGEQRADGVGVDEGADLFQDKVWLRDVWLPGTREVLTYGVTSNTLFRVVKWDGPEHGPYYHLSYTDVPGNLLPLPPASLWRDLHEIANSLFRKLANQAMSKKRVAGFQGGNDTAVANLKRAKDGEGIVYDGQPPVNLDVGGIDQPTLAMFLQTRDLFSYFGGNLDALGGLSPQTETGVQDKMLNDAAGARTDAMRATTIAFVKKVFKALAWYEWTDPARERIIEKPIDGTDIVLQRVWSEETREGDFIDYNLDIDPYSMQNDTPSIRLQKVGQVFERYIIPLLPVIQQQGGQIDIQKLLDLVSKLANVDEIRNLVSFGAPTPGAEQQGGSPQPQVTGKPAHTTRTYERVNRPGATRHGKDDVLTRMLMGGGVQESEAAALGRPNS